MGENNPRQLCGKTGCPNVGKWTSVLADKIPEKFPLVRGWANSLSLAVEALGFSEAKEKAQVRRLAFNLSKHWDKLGQLEFDHLANMAGPDFIKIAIESEGKCYESLIARNKIVADAKSAAKKAEKERTKRSPSGFSRSSGGGGGGGSWLENLHEDGGDWFRNC